MKDAILAIDSGGSKCDVLLVDMDGEILGAGHAQLPGEGGRSQRALTKALRGAIVQREFGTIYVTTVSWLIPASVLHSLGAKQIVLLPCSEEEAAFAFAGVDFGIVLLAGTGAFAHGVGRDGKAYHFDGAGPMLGDFGSGFHLGTLALQAVIRSDWHPRHATSLRARALGLCGVDYPMELIEKQLFMQDRSLIASLARVVGEEALAGDAIAQRVIEQAADALASTFEDLVMRMELTNERFPVIGTGSIIQRIDPYRDHLWRRVAEIAPGAECTHLDVPPVVSLEISALRRILGNEAAAPIQRMVDSIRTEKLADKERR